MTVNDTEICAICKKKINGNGIHINNYIVHSTICFDIINNIINKKNSGILSEKDLNEEIAKIEILEG